MLDNMCTVKPQNTITRYTYKDSDTKGKQHRTNFKIRDVSASMH